MLSLFPYFFSWHEWPQLFIRLALGGVFLYWSYKEISNRQSSGKVKTVAIIEGIAGLLTIVGFMTQLAAIVIGIDLIVRLVMKATKKQFLSDGVNYYLLLLVLAFTLLVYGAGVLSRDMNL